MFAGKILNRPSEREEVTSFSEILSKFIQLVMYSRSPNLGPTFFE
jgi:hypothetical protein